MAFSPLVLLCVKVFVAMWGSSCTWTGSLQTRNIAFWIKSSVYWSEIKPSEWSVRWCHNQKAKFDCLPLNICYVRLNRRPHAVTSEGHVHLSTLASSVAYELLGVPASAPLRPRGTDSPGLSHLSSCFCALKFCARKVVGKINNFQSKAAV